LGTEVRPVLNVSAYGCFAAVDHDCGRYRQFVDLTLIITA
jgi:hypothetical protein